MMRSWWTILAKTLVAGGAWAAAWPAPSTRLISPSPPGRLTDTSAPLASFGAVQPTLPPRFLGADAARYGKRVCAAGIATD
jgi:hypothetical protein